MRRDVRPTAEGESSNVCLPSRRGDTVRRNRGAGFAKRRLRSMNRRGFLASSATLAAAPALGCAQSDSGRNASRRAPRRLRRAGVCGASSGARPQIRQLYEATAFQPGVLAASRTRSTGCSSGSAIRRRQSRSRSPGTARRRRTVTAITSGRSTASASSSSSTIPPVRRFRRTSISRASAPYRPGGRSRRRARDVPR